MARSYYLELSRNDTGQTSRFAGSELEDAQEMDWLESYFLRAVHQVISDNTAKPVKGPLTFLVKIGGALFPIPRWEIFIYSTPYTVMKPFINAFKTLDHSSVCEGSSYLPDDVLPFCQIFRGRLLRFYTGSKGSDKVMVPAIYWHIDQPVLTTKELDLASLLVDEPEIADPLWVRAEIVGKAGNPSDFFPVGEGPTGNLCRQKQRGLPGLAILEES